MVKDQTIYFKALQALHGDALQIRYFGDDKSYHNIFIDGGFISTFRRTIKKDVENIINSKEKIDLFIITHTDSDHISGVLQFVKEFGHLGLVKKYWFNHFDFITNIDDSSQKISISDGILLRDLLKKSGEVSNKTITEGNRYSLYGAKITILSPNPLDLDKFYHSWRKNEEFDKMSKSQIATDETDYSHSILDLSKKKFVEDQKLVNRTSISFIFEIYDKKLLILADSHPTQIITALTNLGYSSSKRLNASCVKLPHHASKRNINNDLISIINSDSYIISANGKNQFGFPHKEPLSRILGHMDRDLSHRIKLFFNYNNEILQSIFTVEEEESFNFQLIFPRENDYGISITI